MPKVDGIHYPYDEAGKKAAKKAAQAKGVEVEHKSDGGIIGSTQRRRARQGAEVVR